MQSHVELTINVEYRPVLLLLYIGINYVMTDLGNELVGQVIKICSHFGSSRPTSLDVEGVTMTEMGCERSSMSPSHTG